MVAPGEVQPMKMEEAELTQLDLYVLDDAWAMEQKYDGTRVLARVGSRRLDFVSFGGAHVTHAAAALHFPALRRELAQWVEGGATLILDGELLPHCGKFVVYDMPLLTVGEGGVGPDMPLHARRAALETLFAAWPESRRPSIQLSSQATTPEEKADLFRRVSENNCEGVVLKRLDGTYEHQGRRVRHQLKVKLVKDCDAVILERNVGGATNAVLGMYDEDGKMRQVGKCSMIGKDPTAKPMDVAVVRFLYATSSLTLYQPRFMHLRTDKRPEECLIRQLVPVSKDVV